MIFRAVATRDAVALEHDGREVDTATPYRENLCEITFGDGVVMLAHRDDLEGVTRDMITDSQARRIAAEWHGGQASALYALASSGAVDADAVRNEISRDIVTLEVGVARRDLLALDTYVRHAGERGRQEGWARLWDETPVRVSQC
jgi:hypothetical protein